MKASPLILLATGGSGGHIYPAVAVARAATGRGANVVLMGEAGGMEERAANEAGVEFIGVPAGKWHRGRPDPRHALRALRGLVAARRHVRRLRPDLIIGFGGFASFPGALSAILERVPLILHEGNAYPSLVNRWLAPRAKLLIAAQEDALTHLRARKTAVIPFPVREERLAKSAARTLLGLPQEGVVTLVMGGSQGSLALNRAVPAAYAELPERARGVVLHSTGEKWHADVAESVQGLSDYHAHPYLPAPAAWSAADLAITRAGVGTLSEAAYHGVPLLMVPLPSAAGDHQLHNARAFEAAGAGRVVLEEHMSGLKEVWLAALAREWREPAAAAATARTPEGAAERIFGAAEGVIVR